jgi:hypothetical protein
MKRQLVYIAGKYRARTIYGRIINILKVYRAARKLTKQGYVCIVPHMETALMDGLQSDEWFLSASIKKLKHCDAIYMLKGWQESDGSCLERLAAQQRGMKVWYEDGNLLERLLDTTIFNESDQIGRL